MALVMFFCSPTYDLDVVAEEMNQRFNGVPIIGCTTAGEIGPLGCVDDSLSGASFSAGSFGAAVGGIERLSDFGSEPQHEFVQSLLQDLERRAPSTRNDNTVRKNHVRRLGDSRDRLVWHRRLPA